MRLYKFLGDYVFKKSYRQLKEEIFQGACCISFDYGKTFIRFDNPYMEIDIPIGIEINVKNFHYGKV